MLGGPHGVQTDRGELGGNGSPGSQSVYVCGCEREDRVILTLNLHPAVTPNTSLHPCCPSLLTRQSTCRPVGKHLTVTVFTRLHFLSFLPQLFSSCSLSFLFFSVPHKCTGIALPAPLSTVVLSVASRCIVCSPSC